MSEMQVEMNLNDALEANKIEQAALLEKIKARDAEQRTAALAPVLAVIKQHGFSAVELRFKTLSPERNVKGATDLRSKVAPKYRDPETSTTWTGRGKTPAWMAAHIAAGRDKSEFLIELPILDGADKSATTPG